MGGPDDYFDPELYEEIRNARREIMDELEDQEPFPGIAPGPMPFAEGNEYDAYEPDDPKGWPR